MNAAVERNRRRKLLAKNVRWLTYVEKAEPCDGIKWNTVALKDLYEHGPRSDPIPARGIQDKSKCQAPAHWRYKAAKPRNKYDYAGNSGTYCWSHVWSQVEAAADYKRFRAAAAKLNAKEGWD